MTSDGLRIILCIIFVLILYGIWHKDYLHYYITCRCKKEVSHAENLRRLRYMYKTVCRIFNQYDVPHFTACGTLLGIIRDGDLLPWDSDVDMIIDGESSANVFRLLKTHLPSDLNVVTYNHNIAVFDQFNLHLDIYAYKPYDNEYGPYHFQSYWLARLYMWIKAKHANYTYPMDAIHPIRKIKWEDIIISIPHDPERMLEHEYGKTWRTPIQY